MFENKNILVLGLGITGRSAISCLANFPCKIYVYDEKIQDFSFLKEAVKIFREENFCDIDFVIKSPGIHPNHPIVKKARALGIEVISDLELAYRMTACKNMVAITGTNGKTTTATMVGKLLSTQYKTYVVGNIGVGILDIVNEVKEEDYIVIEASSFQLEDTLSFRPHMALITYVTKDHLDWHETEEQYRRAKFKIFAQQNSDDLAIVNGEDAHLQQLDLTAQRYTFQVEEHQNCGTFVREGEIFFRRNGNEQRVLSVDDIKVPGRHNLMNVLAAVCIAKLCGIEDENIQTVISQFYGVEHRIEFVAEQEGVKYYNDSKGTNPDSTMVAVDAMDGDTVLIAGGYDKSADFRPMLRHCRNKISTLILFGQTAQIMAKAAKEFEYHTVIVQDLKAALMMARQSVHHPGNILLSPACASWDMYRSYEERGNHFKQLVKEWIE